MEILSSGRKKTANFATKKGSSNEKHREVEECSGIYNRVKYILPNFSSFECDRCFH